MLTFEWETQMKIRGCRFAVSALLLLLAAVVANAQNCSSSITACGCTISSAGTYTVTADLSAAQGLTSGNGCIDVNASNVKLFTNGYNITGAGTGTGIGIHLLSGRTNVFLSAAGPQETYTLVSGWQYGMESQASTVTSEGFYFQNNTTGVWLRGAQNNNFGCLGAFDNTLYGVWIRGGSANQIDYAGTWDNGIAGVYLGCSTTGPSGPACSGGSTTTGNSVFGLLSFTTGVQSYGLVVETGGTQNNLVDNSFSGDTVDDLFDGNASANSNTWHSNLFTTANKGYIH